MGFYFVLVALRLVPVIWLAGNLFGRGEPSRRRFIGTGRPEECREIRSVSLVWGGAGSSERAGGRANGRKPSARLMRAAREAAACSQQLGVGVGGGAKWPDLSALKLTLKS